jgi:serpin B
MKPTVLLPLAGIFLLPSGTISHAAEPGADRLLAFGCDLYRLHAARTQAAESVAFSPVNLAQVLDLLAQVSAGDTRSQLAAALHYPAGDALPLPAASAFPAPAADSGLILTQATGLWPAKNFTLTDGTAARLEEKFHAALSPLDFNDAPAAMKTINAWAGERTAGKITQLLPGGVLNKDTRMVAASALLFQGKWVQPFDPALTKSETFTTAGGAKIKTPLMHLTLAAPYVQWPDGTQALELAFAGGPLSLLVLLPPAEKGGLPALEARLTPDFLAAVHGRLKKQAVQVKLPKFTLQASLPAEPLMKALGAGDLFSNADFSPLSPEPDLAVGALLHQATFTCDESGAEASAASAAVIVAKSARPAPPPQFKADRPFVFAVIHRETLDPLLMGRCARPESGAASKPEAKPKAKKGK